MFDRRKSPALELHPCLLSLWISRRFHSSNFQDFLDLVSRNTSEFRLKTSHAHHIRQSLSSRWALKRSRLINSFIHQPAEECSLACSLLSLGSGCRRKDNSKCGGCCKGRRKCTLTVHRQFELSLPSSRTFRIARYLWVRRKQKTNLRNSLSSSAALQLINQNFCVGVGEAPAWTREIFHHALPLGDAGEHWWTLTL